ncbi:MAG: DUF1385 domain-containing protein [Halanaerobiales bacterium]
MCQGEKEKDTIGGRAYGNGVRLMNSNYTAKAFYDKENNLRVQVSRVKRSKYLNYIKKVPILRGIVSLLFAVIMFLKEGVNNPGKYWAILLIVVVDIIFMMLPSSVGESTMNLLMLLYILIPVVLLIIFKDIIVEILKYHGAEHKTVHYYENDCKGDIQSYSRLHKRCGSNIVFYYLIISLSTIFIYIPINPFLLQLIFLGIAYEAIKYTPDKLLFLPYLFQRIVTREPEEKHIRAAESALEALTYR